MHGVKYIHGLPFSSNKRRKLKKVVGHFFFFLRCKKFKFASDEEKWRDNGVRVSKFIIIIKFIFEFENFFEYKNFYFRYGKNNKNT